MRVTEGDAGFVFCRRVDPTAIRDNRLVPEDGAFDTGRERRSGQRKRPA